GQMAVMSSSFHVDGPKEAIVCGTEGSLRVPLFWRGTQLILEKPGQEPLTLDIPFESTGLQYQAAAAMDNIREGLSVNPIMPPSESLRIMRMMNRLRAEWR
ncbi:MAG: gfo/Idh/MocA family oxidoreductase, partial [Bacteroidetes bacterium]